MARARGCQRVGRQRDFVNFGGGGNEGSLIEMAVSRIKAASAFSFWLLLNNQQMQQNFRPPLESC